MIEYDKDKQAFRIEVRDSSGQKFATYYDLKFVLRSLGAVDQDFAGRISWDTRQSEQVIDEILGLIGFVETRAAWRVARNRDRL